MEVASVKNAAAIPQRGKKVESILPRIFGLGQQTYAVLLFTPEKIEMNHLDTLDHRYELCRTRARRGHLSVLTTSWWISSARVKTASCSDFLPDKSSFMILSLYRSHHSLLTRPTVPGRKPHYLGSRLLEEEL